MDFPVKANDAYKMLLEQSKWHENPQFFQVVINPEDGTHVEIRGFNGRKQVSLLEALSLIAEIVRNRISQPTHSTMTPVMEAHNASMLLFLDFLSGFGKTGVEQLDYDLRQNLKSGLITQDEQPEHWLRISVSSAFGAATEWSIESARLFAAEVLENVNDNGTAKLVYDGIRKDSGETPESVTVNIPPPSGLKVGGQTCVNRACRILKDYGESEGLAFRSVYDKGASKLQVTGPLTDKHTTYILGVMTGCGNHK